MANNTQLNQGSGGDIIATYDLNVGGAYPTTGKLPCGTTFVGSPPTPVSAANAFPVTLSGVALPTGSNVIGGVTQSGVWTMNLTQIGGAALAFGQAVMASSLPVTIASNQSALTLAALPAGANTIGSVTQASGPWTTNQTQWNGTAVDVNSGNKSAGTVRVVLATDQPTLTNTLGPVTLPNLEAGLSAGAAPSKMTVVGAQHNITPPALTNGQTVANQCDQVGALRVNIQSQLPTYIASSGSFTLAANPTDIAQISGSSTKTIKILKILGQFTSSSTTPGVTTVFIYKRSAADTGMTNGMSSFAFDSTNAAVTATTQYTTTNPTVGGSVGFFAIVIPYLSTAALLESASGGNLNVVLFDASTLGAQPIILRGTAQTCAINLNGAGQPAAATGIITFIFTEDDS